MNAVYMLCYYLGATVGSAAGVKVMSVAGWHSLVFFGIALAGAALAHNSWKQIHGGRTGQRDFVK